MAEKLTVYMVMRDVKSGYYVHSIHKESSVAEEWKRCLSHDGTEEYEVAAVDVDTLKDFAHDQGWF